MRSIAVPELAEEELAEAGERLRLLDGRRGIDDLDRAEHADQGRDTQAQGASADDRGFRVAPLMEAREERRRVRPEIEAGIVAHLLAPREIVGLAALREAELVDHQLEPRLVGGAEEVEDAGGRRNGEAERREIDRAAERARVHGLGEEAVEVADRDRGMHGELSARALALAAPRFGIADAEREAAGHGLAEGKAEGLVAHGGASGTN